MSGFRRRSRMVRDAQEAIDRQKQQDARRREEEEAAAKARAAEAKALNEEVNRRLSSSYTKEPEDGNKSIDRRGVVSAREAALINKIVKRKATMMEAERERRRSSEMSITPPKLSDRASGTPKHTDRSERTASTPASSERREVSTRKEVTPKAGWARARLATMTDEMGVKKQALGLERSESPVPDPSAKRVGAARAAAKVAGGVFYTLTENREMVAKLKHLDARNKELEARLKAYEQYGALKTERKTEGEDDVSDNLAARDSSNHGPRDSSTPGPRRWATNAVLNAAAALRTPVRNSSFKKKDGDPEASPLARRWRSLSGGATAVAFAAVNKTLGLGDEYALHNNASPVLLVRPPTC